MCRDIETIRYSFLLPDLMSFDPFPILLSLVRARFGIAVHSLCSLSPNYSLIGRNEIHYFI